MAKVTYKRVQTNAEIDGIPVLDGQLIYTGQGKTYMDYGTDRVPINGTPDTEMSESSNNPVENWVIKQYVDTNLTNVRGEMIKATILWENEDPTEAWGSQRQITVNSSDYDMYEVIYIPGVSNAYTSVKSTGKIPKGKTTQLDFVYSGGGTNPALVRRREFAYVDDTHYTVGTNIGADGDYACRPLVVIGYKTGLFE